MTGSPGTAALVHAVWADQPEVPSGDDWLTAAEATVLGGLRFPKRRGDWRVGRWAAKRAVAACLGHDVLRDVQVLAAGDGSPVVEILGASPEPVSLSLSHSGGRGFAVAARGRTALGCDLEVLAARSSAFIVDYLTERERDAVTTLQGPERDEAATLVWAAKEAALKALRQGLRADTRSVEVRPEEPPPTDGRWGGVTVVHAGGGLFRGWLRSFDGFAWAVVADAPGRPTLVGKGMPGGAAD